MNNFRQESKTRREFFTHVKPCCVVRQGPSPGLLCCMRWALIPCPDHRLPRNCLVLQVLLVTKPCTGLPAQGFLLISCHTHQTERRRTKAGVCRLARSVQCCRLSELVDTAVEKEPLCPVSPSSLAKSVASSFDLPWI